jgi:hypothetical protein
MGFLKHPLLALKNNILNQVLMQFKIFQIISLIVYGSSGNRRENRCMVRENFDEELG